jgi:hypothetical protein
MRREFGQVHWDECWKVRMGYNAALVTTGHTQSLPQCSRSHFPSTSCLTSPHAQPRGQGKITACTCSCWYKTQLSWDTSVHMWLHIVTWPFDAANDYIVTSSLAVAR